MIPYSINCLEYDRHADIHFQLFYSMGSMRLSNIVLLDPISLFNTTMTSHRRSETNNNDNIINLRATSELHTDLLRKTILGMSLSTKRDVILENFALTQCNFSSALKIVVKQSEHISMGQI